MSGISKCKDIVSFNKILDYLQTFKRNLNDPSKIINTKDEYAEKCLDDLLTYGAINQYTADQNFFHQKTINKAYSTIIKQDLVNNCKIDISQVVSDHFSTLNKTYFLNKMIENAIEHHIKKSKLLEEKSLPEIMKLKEDLIFFMHSKAVKWNNSTEQFEQIKAIESIDQFIKQKVNNLLTIE